MVCSLDGFIAKPDNTVDWMHTTDNYDKGITLTDDYITEFLESIDCYVMGSKTYEHALNLGWPYGDKPVYVLTQKDRIPDKESVSFVKEDLHKWVSEYLRSHYQNIWMVGGAKLTKEFIQQQLADEIVISIMPVLLGKGTLFFDYVGVEQKLHLQDVSAYTTGMVEMTYEVLHQGFQQGN